jgi:hypothetical protein
MYSKGIQVPPATVQPDKTSISMWNFTFLPASRDRESPKCIFYFGWGGGRCCSKSNLRMKEIRTVRWRVVSTKVNLHCLHPIVYYDWWYLAVNTTIEIRINQSKCSHWFYLIVATCFGPHMGPSSGSLSKYFSCYWTALIWIHISAAHHNHIVHATITKLEDFF